MKKKKLIVGNWKMNPLYPKEAKALFSEIGKMSKKTKKSTIIVCPPALYIPLAPTTKSFSVGTQDIFYEKEGAFTGSISAKMARESGASWSIIGHSEMRKHGDTPTIINHKILAALKDHVRPIVCVGERVRDDKGLFWNELKTDIEECFKGVKKPWLADVVIAYEPLWAIGIHATRDATSDEIHEVIIFIKKVLADMFGQKNVGGISYLYGGSVTPKNAAAIMHVDGVEGVLVGRSSLKPKEFAEIIKISETL